VKRAEVAMCFRISERPFNRLATLTIGRAALTLHLCVLGVNQFFTLQTPKRPAS
jgi:hypothetical protein